MSIISYNYVQLLEKCVQEAISNNFRISKFNSYLEMMENLQAGVAACVRNAIIYYFEKIDSDYCSSKDRKSRYYYSGTYSRTLITVFGEIQFKRKYYYPKNGCADDGFYYVDQLLNLPRYDCYDMIVKAMIFEEKAKATYSLAAEIVSKKISEYSGQNITISRQLAYQVFNKVELEDLIEENLIEETPKELRNDETIYIILDEKYIHTKDYYASNDGKLSDKMVKHAILYTGKTEEYKGRYKLENKVVFSSCGSSLDLANVIQTYIDTHFNETIKNIVVAGDGASWILQFYKDFNLPYIVKKLFVLDVFHVGQAVCRISINEKDRKDLNEAITLDKKDDFIFLCKEIGARRPERKDKIEKNMNYITGHWFYILNAKNPLFIGCPMESHISHNLAKVFSRDPKAYALANIAKHIRLRDLQLNGINIRNLYLYSMNHTTVPLEPVGTTEPLIKPNFQPLINANNAQAIQIAYGIDDIKYI